MSEVRERVERLSIVYPDLAPAAEPLLDRLEQLASAYPPDPLVPSHSSFRPAQALIYKDQIGFIDFDSFCQSEPANFHACFARLVKVGKLSDIIYLLKRFLQSKKYVG